MINKIYFIFIALLFLNSCVYYNTMFNANRLYDEGVKKIANNKSEQITPDIRKDFYSAIDKCWKLINMHGDSNKWADDALLLIGKSYYHIEEYNKSERYLSQFLQLYAKSDLINEGKLWYAKSLIALERESEAVTFLNEILTQDVADNFKSEIFYSFANFYLNNEEYDKAVKYLKQCVELSDDDILSAQAQILIGDIYFDSGEYIRAIENYNEVREYNAPQEIEFRSLFQKIEAQLILEEYELALKTINTILRDARFQDRFSLIEAKKGECFVLRDELDRAADQYQFVMKEYPRTEGSAEAAFGLAQIMEYEYNELDSARVLYQKVPREFARSEKSEESKERAKILQDYLKIKNNLLEAKETYKKNLLKADSLAQIQPEADDSTIAVTDSVTKSDSLEQNKGINQLQKTEQDLKKNKKLIAELQYQLAEFFLLNMENPDSAIIAYNNFIETGYDSSLIPKATYALFYIYDYIKQDSSDAQPYKEKIEKNYSDTPFAGYFKKDDSDTLVSTVDTLKLMYRDAEDALMQNNLETALQKFRDIAQIDSGGDWGGKARYAIAWIYENKYKDIPDAIDAYQTVLKEYPNTEYARIAQNKIKEPPAEKTEIASDSTDVAQTVEPDTVQTEDNQTQENQNER